MLRLPLRPPLAAAVGLHRWQPGPNSYSDPIAWRLGLVPTIALAALALVLLSGSDRSLFLALNAWAAQWPAPVWSWVTALGDGALVFCIMLPLVLRRADAAAAALLTIVLVSVGVHALKDLFDWLRPAAVLPPGSFTVIGPTLHMGAFPSGHTAAIFSLAALIAGYSLNRVWVWACIALAALVGFSRIAVGAHWPSDVLAGAALGWLGGYTALHLAACCPGWLKRVFYYLALAFLVFATVALLTFIDSGYPYARLFERALALLSLGFFAVFLYHSLRALLRR